MKNHLNLKSFSIWLIALTLVIGGVLLAGDLTPPGSPEATYVSLNDIYDKLTTGATTTEKSFTPTEAPTSTMHTLSEIFEALPEWLTLSDATTTVSAGYYEATDLATIDTDLVAGNIAEGTTIFGVTGNVSAGNNVELHTGQDGTPKSYTDNGNDTVTDNQTGLVWQKYDSRDVSPGSCSNGADGCLSYMDALQYCSNLDLGGYPIGSWKLPTALEGATLFDYSLPGDWQNPALSNDWDFYWTRTYYGPANTFPPSTAYYVFYFDQGFIYGSPSIGQNSVSPYRARCVHD